MTYRRWIALLALVAASVALAEDPPATPQRHENKVSPEAQAAMEKFVGLVYVPAEHGLETVKGVIVPVGLQSHAHPTFELVAAGSIHVAGASGLEDERRALKLDGNFIRFPLATAYDPSDVFDDSECDAEMAQGERGQVLRLDAYGEGKPTGRAEFEFDGGGLLLRETWRGPPGDSRGDYVETYTWTQVGELHCVASIDVTMESENHTRYVCAFRYADVQGVHLVTSYEMTFFAKDAAPRKFTFHVDDLVVNGRAVELPRPWKHVNKVSPEAKAAIENHAKLAYRPADRGLRTLAASIVIDDVLPAKWRLEFTPPGLARVRPAEGQSPTPQQQRSAWMQFEIPLRAALAGGAFPDSDEYDAEFVEKDGRRVLVVRTFLDGALTGGDEFTFAPTGLVETIRPGADRADAPNGVLTFGWEPRGGLHRLSSFESSMQVGDRTVHTSHSFTWSEASGIPIVTSSASTRVLKEGEKEIVQSAAIRVTDLVVNGAKVEATNPGAHRNQISPEARTALDRFEKLVYRPVDHGLVTASGTLAPGGLAFEVARRGVGMRPVAREADPRTANMADHFRVVLLVATHGPPLAGEAEYDAEFVDRLGTPVLAVTVFKDGKALERREAILDETGLVSSIRFVLLAGGPITSEWRLAWTRVGDRWQVARVDMWDATMAMHMFVVYAYSEVAGIRLPLSIRYSLANLGAEFDGKGIEFSVADLVVNGKKAETPKSPFHVNEVTAEARKLLADHERQVFRPSEHGLRSASGLVTTGESQAAVRCQFAFAAPRFLTATANPRSRADTPEGRTAEVRARFPLLLALDSLRTVDSLEFDARVLTRDGQRVVEVVEYLRGARTSTSQFTFDAGGLVATSRRTDGPSEPGQPTDTCMRLGWERIGDKARIVWCDLSTGSFDAPGRTSFIVAYSRVAGIDVPVSWTVTSTMGGAPVESAFRVEDLVVNGKPVEIPQRK